MKKVYGYIRVSTVKQGTGVSLQEQKEAIIRYAEKHELSILEWFEEKETAAKQGRTLFTRMMKFLQSGKAAGVIIHKIDRSARNLKDWAALGDLIDQGIEVHFAHESLDLDTRGGRLAADIQAVIASDYIRNLRDEAKKGLYGRLKQGIYPFGAPIGYNNNGRGRLKTIDPVQGPLVRKAFELYANGNYTLKTLIKFMGELGFRNSKGGLIHVSEMSTILNNPFYTGVMKIKGKTYAGNHEPLVPSTLFLKVRNVLEGKTNTRPLKHVFTFRRLIKCAYCHYSIIGETKKGHIYYRCHTTGCPTMGIREEVIENTIIMYLDLLQLQSIESKILNEMLAEAENNWLENQSKVEMSLRLQKGNALQKLDRLTDAYVEGSIGKEVFEEKKEVLLIELQMFNEKSRNISNAREVIFRQGKNFLELIKVFKKAYITGIAEEKRKILKSVTSNLELQGKKLMFSMQSPFQEIANKLEFYSGDLDPNTPRICTAEIANLATCDLEPNIPRFCKTEIANSDNFPAPLADTPELRARMKELLEMIMAHFNKEVEKNPDVDEEEEL